MVSATSNPQLKESRYERASSWTFAAFAAVSSLCLFIIVSYLLRVPLEPKPLPIVVIPIDPVDGNEDSSEPTSRQQVDLPMPAPEDKVLAEEQADQPDLPTILSSVVELADQATLIAVPSWDQADHPRGSIGRPKDSSRIFRPPSNIPPEQRWLIRFADKLSLEEYARQLDFFHIELGVVLPDGRLAYLEQLATDAPRVRYAVPGAKDNRLYMSWQNGDRQAADRLLFAKAGVSVSGDSRSFHFYSAEIEKRLLQLEHDYKNRTVQQIRRTYFTIEKRGRGYEFVVIRQIPL